MTLTTEQVRERLEIFAREQEKGETPEKREIAGLYASAFAELLANREAQLVTGKLGKISVGRLQTMNQENYPGLGDWWVQLRIGVHNDEILARVYGATPEEATARAHALTAPPAPAVVNGRTAEGWMAEALLQKSVADALRKSLPAVSEGECYKFPGRWIDCTDALPQNGENIITLNNIGGVYGGYIFKRYESGGWAFVDAEEEFRVDDSITHWMPLPAAPEGGNG
ncbi:hypothetical protein BSF37_03160 [Serratia marcescens]|uniref:DUF551 domain-containing protein n=1 Tax=Serratia marcescens TaxID=615 RepID=UPI0014817A3D|nr:DUF551 domain-containing protein [Serratia marcescens]NMM70785.1 hypothetical protein [Serratia marcescens]